MALSEKEQQICTWIDSQHETMLEQVICWSSLCSGTFHVEGVNQQGIEVAKLLEKMGAEVQSVAVPPFQKITEKGKTAEETLGNAIVAHKRDEVTPKVLLSGHLDTVFGKEHSFQSVTRLSNTQIQGPGIIDLKAGLVVLLTALQAIEKIDIKHFGWRCVFSPDEEIGSASSAGIIREQAKGCIAGLVFEPPYTDGAFVNERGSSAYYVIQAEGRASHVGRHYREGRSAIRAAARLVEPIEQLNSDDLVVNIGSIDGGSPSNVVPSLALIRINIRAKTQQAFTRADQSLQELIHKEDGFHDVRLTLIKGPFREPKPFDTQHQKVFSFLKDCCQELSIPYHCRFSGGVCDGNIIAAAGVPTIDTLGALGGNIHTSREYLEVHSLTERAKLTALFLNRYTQLRQT